MKLDELLGNTLLEGKRLEIYEDLLPLLLIEDGDGGGGGGFGDIPTPNPPDTPPIPSTPGNGGWGHGPFRPGGGMNGNHWFGEFYNTLKNLIIAGNVLKRMKELGISAAGTKRIKDAAKKAAKNVNDLLSNPRATAYRIPQWTFDSPKTPVIKRWNEAFAHEFKAELTKLTESSII